LPSSGFLIDPHLNLHRFCARVVDKNHYQHHISSPTPSAAERFDTDGIPRPVGTMAGFNGRRAPNVSQYVANLNAIPDVAGQQDENFNLDSELAQFTNTDFIDFDTANFLDNPAPEYDAGQDEQGKRNGSAHNSIDGKGLDFVNGM